MDNSATAVSSYENYQLLKNYVGVCNDALKENAQRFPFSRIFDVAQRSEKEKPVEVVVRSSKGEERYVFRIEAGGIVVQAHEECAKCECVRTWNPQTPYLENVTRSPQDYIQNPAKLDWEWMFDA